MGKPEDSGPHFTSFSPSRNRLTRMSVGSEGEDEFFSLLKYAVIPGAIGGVGGVFIELRGIARKKEETTEIPVNPTNDYWLPALFEKPGVISIDFFLYLFVSLSLGAISSFIFTLCTMGIPDEKNRWRIVSSAMLFGLLFPSTTKFLYHSFLSQAERNVDERYQTELRDLKADKAELTAEVNALIDEMAGVDPANIDISIMRDRIERYQRLIRINDENPNARMESIRDLGDLAIAHYYWQPEIIQQIQTILENIGQTDPDLEVQEEANIQLQRIAALN